MTACVSGCQHSSSDKEQSMFRVVRDTTHPCAGGAKSCVCPNSRRSTDLEPSRHHRFWVTMVCSFMDCSFIFPVLQGTGNGAQGTGLLGPSLYFKFLQQTQNSSKSLRKRREKHCVAFLWDQVSYTL